MQGGHSERDTGPVNVQPAGPCAQHVDGKMCGSEIGTRSYLTGACCPLHTPAAMHGRAEPQVPDQDAWVAAHPPSEPLEFYYGTATSDPLGRLGWNAAAKLPSHKRGEV